MGLALFSSCSDCLDNPVADCSMAPNPNPARFTISELRQVGKNVVARIHYPGCTNFEGVKICVFKNTTCGNLRILKEIDPHFSENKFSLFARFRPDAEGWAAACCFAQLEKDMLKPLTEKQKNKIEIKCIDGQIKLLKLKKIIVEQRGK